MEALHRAQPGQPRLQNHFEAALLRGEGKVSPGHRFQRRSPSRPLPGRPSRGRGPGLGWAGLPLGPGPGPGVCPPCPRLAAPGPFLPCCHTARVASPGLLPGNFNSFSDERLTGPLLGSLASSAKRIIFSLLPAAQCSVSVLPGGCTGLPQRSLGFLPCWMAGCKPVPCV